MNNKIEITVLTNKEDVASLRHAMPEQNDVITGYIARYVNKDISVLPLMVELLKGKDFKLKKRLLYALKNIRYTTDWNFQITEPILIETLFSLIKYKSLEFPLLDVLLTYKMEGYIGVLEKWFAASNSVILVSILYHLTYIGRYDCLRMLEKKAAKGNKVAWYGLLMAMKEIGKRCDKAGVAYLEAITMHLFRRDIISLKNIEKEYHYNFMHLLCLYGTEEVAPLIDEITPFLQKDYLAYFNYRTETTSDLTGILKALHQHKNLFSYRDFASSIGISNMSDEWKVAILQHFQENKIREDKFDNALWLSRMFDWSGSPDFIKDNISLINDVMLAKSLLKLHAIKTLPGENVLSDMLDAGLLKDIQRERALYEISNGQRNAPHELPGYVMQQLSEKLVHDYSIEPMEKRILQWAKDCGTPFDGLIVSAEFDEGKMYSGVIKAALHDKGYIVKDLSGKGFQDFEPVKLLLNTILECENVPERIVEISNNLELCDVFGDVEKLQALAAKYDFRQLA